MKIGFHIAHWSHGFSSVEYLFDVLKSKGHECILQVDNSHNKNWNNGEVDIMIHTSNVEYLLFPEVKTYFIPHGMGIEPYTSFMRKYEKVFLNGLCPYLYIGMVEIPSNVDLVGWSKSDILWHPEQHKVDLVREEIENLPYDRNILFYTGIKVKERFDWMSKYCHENKFNLIFPQRPDCIKIHDGLETNFILIPKILNLYYYTPYLDLVITTGTSIGREFYITDVPVIMPYYQDSPEHRSEEPSSWAESYQTSMMELPDIIPKVLKTPENFLRPEETIKRYFTHRDGKVTERIIRELNLNMERD